MTVWVFTYDLRNKTGKQNYQPLWDELDRLNGHRVQDSVWLLNLDNTAQELVEHFKTFVHKDDRLWISELTKKHWFVNAKSGTNDWLAANPPER